MPWVGLATVTRKPTSKKRQKLLDSRSSGFGRSRLWAAQDQTKKVLAGKPM